MFERFSDEARRVVVLAQEEARLLNHNYIGTEHILLGLVRDGEGVACRALETLGVSLDRMRRRVEEKIGHGSSAPSGHIPFTPRAKKVLELSLREALELGHNYIGTEHILLGLVREGEGVACQVLVEAGVELSRLRATVIQLLTDGRTAPQAARLVQGTALGPRQMICSFCGRDLWDVTHYIAGAHAAICEECVDASRAQLEDAVARGADAGAVHLPPRVSGNPPTDYAVGEIVEAFQSVFGSKDRDEDPAARPLEDVESLLPALEEAGRRYPNVGPADISVLRIRFRTVDSADVRFTVIGSLVEGPAVRDAGTWKVSREACCQVLRLAGVPCPPRESS